MKSKICFWFIFGFRQQLKKSFAHSTQFMRICWVAGYLVFQKWRILIHTEYTESICMWGRREGFPDVPAGLGARVYACCLDIIMGTVCFQLKTALVWNVNYTWHACVREKQTDGNSAAQWFTSGVQRSRHRTKEKRKILQRFRRHPGIRWGNQEHEDCRGCSFFVQGLSWNKQKGSEHFLGHREMRSLGTLLVRKYLKHWKKANRDGAVSQTQ